MIHMVRRMVGLRTLVTVLMLVGWSTSAHAQEAVITGSVTDDTGGVLPGVTITAVHVATGNTFEAVTDGRGAYRIPVRVGVLRMTAALEGFAKVTRTDFEVLAGQEMVANFKLSPGAIQESI